LDTKRIAVIAFIGNKGRGAAGGGLLCQKRSALVIAGLAAGEPDAPQPSIVIRYDMKLGGKTALAAA
jgi:hypothetical protein